MDDIQDRYGFGILGCVVHDDDCYISRIKVCTCGLLHDLFWLSNPEKYYPMFYDEIGDQQIELDRLEYPNNRSDYRSSMLDYKAIERILKDVFGSEGGRVLRQREVYTD